MKATSDHTDPDGFCVPNWTPPSLNSFTGRHWKAINKAKRDVAELLTVYAMRAGIKRCTYTYRPVRRVRVAVLYAGSKPDPDNLQKVLNDALKRARLIVDDSEEWMTPYTVGLKKTEGEPSTFIFLRDLKLGPEMKPEDDPQVKKLLTQLAKRIARVNKGNPRWHRGT
jgi:hypothetical protein